MSIPYTQTPVYKAVIQTPFSAFNNKNKYNIAHLCKKNSFGVKVQALPLKTNPIIYKKEGAAFFIGLGLQMKNQGHPNIT